MILFEEKKGGFNAITCRVTEWKADWRNSELAIYAETEDGKSVFLRKISYSASAKNGVIIETKDKLESGTEYSFFAVLCQKDGETRLDTAQLGGKTTYQLPHVVHIFYFIEELSSSWFRVSIAVSGSLPKDCLRVQTGKQEYALPYSPKANRIYSFRICIKGNKEDLKIVSSINISNPIERVAKLSILKDKAMED